jgi:hypothetical protein
VKFLAAFLVCAGLFALAYGGAVRWVDPRGEFGGRRFPVVELDARAEKMRLFRAFHEATPPAGLILGSSRSMKLRPRALEEAAGAPFFNFAVDNARAEDYLAIYRWVRQQGVDLRYLVIGLDVEALHDDDRPDPGLVRNPELVQALSRSGLELPLALENASRPGLVGRLKQQKAAFRVEYASDAVRSLRLFWRPADRPLPLLEFEDDGYLRYRRWEEQRAAGTFRFDEDLERCLTKYLGRFDGMSRLSERRRGYLRGVVEEAHGDGARVLVWITALHRRTEQYLEARTSYASLLQDTRAYQEAIAREDGVAVYDFSRPDGNVPGGSGWYDCAHIDEAVADRLADALAAGLR